MSMSQPNPPDPAATMNMGGAYGANAASQQTALNQQAAQEQQKYNLGAQASNNLNTYNPYGSVTTSQVGTSAQGTPIWATNVNYDPKQQALLDTLTNTQGISGRGAGNVLQEAQYGAAPAADVIGDSTRGNTANLVKEYLASVEPSQETTLRQAEDQLKNQGLGPQTDPTAYLNDIRPLEQGIQQANLGAAAGFENTAYNQALQTYNEPAQLALQLAQFGAPTSPTTQAVPAAQLQAPTLNPANVIAAITGEQGIGAGLAEKAYEGNIAQNTAAMSGMFGIPTALLGGLGRNPALASQLFPAVATA